MYNDFMDELEYAAECGFDAICVNEHHSNGYGLMPSPNLIASSLARRTTDTALCVMGNSLALYNPPTRVAEEFAMIDCISGGRLIAGFPVGSPASGSFVVARSAVSGWSVRSSLCGTCSTRVELARSRLRLSRTLVITSSLPPVGESALRPPFQSRARASAAERTGLPVHLGRPRVLTEMTSRPARPPSWGS